MHKPEDCVAAVMWSIDDIRDYFPIGTSDEELLQKLREVESGLKNRMIEAGWEVLDFSFGGKL